MIVKAYSLTGWGWGGIIDCGHFKGFIFNKGFISKMGGGRERGKHTHLIDAFLKQFIGNMQEGGIFG